VGEKKETQEELLLSRAKKGWERSGAYTQKEKSDIRLFGAGPPTIYGCGILTSSR